jgi:RimJ/RimL family protein N-acetyltransferase
VALPVSDGVITVRWFGGNVDRDAIVAARDDVSRRWLGPGSREPAPTACIDVAGTLVGWIDVDRDPPWLQPGEGNVGYCIFPTHRGHGYATRALKLLPAILDEEGLQRGLLVIDWANQASLGVARASGAQLRPDRTITEHPNSVVCAIVTA